MTFTEKLWNACLETGLPELATKTKWIQGIKNGNLDPDDYGKYSVQDVGYCYYARNNWIAAMEKTKEYDIDIYNYCIDEVLSMTTFSESFAKDWHIQPSGIEFGGALEEYINYEKYIIEHYEPSYFLCAMYACYGLWPWTVQQIKPIAPNNLYQGKVRNNLKTKHIKRQYIHE